MALVGELPGGAEAAPIADIVQDQHALAGPGLAAHHLSTE
jgi:hypothetical protein